MAAAFALRGVVSVALSAAAVALAHGAPEPISHAVAGEEPVSVRDVALSPDGAYLYISAGEGDNTTIVAFQRDRRTGAVRGVSGSGGCALAWWSFARDFSRCFPGAGLNTTNALEVTPDGRDLIVGSESGAQVLGIYHRSLHTGKLTLADCVGTNDAGTKPIRCSATTRAATASDLAVSPDGRNVYVASATYRRLLAVFARNTRTGALTELAGDRGCVQHAEVLAPIGCSETTDANFTPEAVTVSPDGRNVYVVSETNAEGGAIFAFARDPSDGALTTVGCLSSKPTGTPCAPLPSGFFGSALAVSPDGRSVYVGAADPLTQQEGVLIVLRRDPASGALSVAQCLSGQQSNTACTFVPGLAAPPELESSFAGTQGALAVAPDGRTLYSAAGNGIVTFRRGPTGTLARLSGHSGSVNGAGYLAVSDDGRTLYSGAGVLRVFRLNR